MTGLFIRFSSEGYVSGDSDFRVVYNHNYRLALSDYLQMQSCILGIL